MFDPIELYLRTKAAQTQTELAGSDATAIALATMAEMIFEEAEIALFASDGGMSQTKSPTASAIPLYWGT